VRDLSNQDLDPRRRTQHQGWADWWTSRVWHVGRTSPLVRNVEFGRRSPRLLRLLQQREDVVGKIGERGDSTANRLLNRTL
jgi:hypothetical protein